MRLAWIGVMALAGCLSSTAADDPPASAMVGGELPCRDGAFAPDASHASLAATFGASDVSSETLEDEGGPFILTTIFADDPTRRLNVRWNDEATLSSPASVGVSGEHSVWTGPLGLSLGSTVEELERLNGRPFEILGWGWDYGGQLWDTRGGALSRDVRGCRLFVYFNFSGDGDLPEALIGDRAIMSNDPALRAVHPTVSAITYRYW